MLSSQVAFTALLKEVIRDAINYVRTSKVILKSERGVNLNHKAFGMREVEDKVDEDRFGTTESFMKEFKQFCEAISKR